MYRYSISRATLAWASVLAGGLLAAGSLIWEGRPNRLPDSAVAMVGEQPIGRAQWLQAVASVESDRGRALTAAERRAVLQKLIDEELLLQQALASGMARDEPGLRKTLIAALIDASTVGGTVDEAEARKLFEQDPGRFAAQPRLRVSALRAPADAESAAVLAALKGGALPEGWRSMALPDQLLPMSQLAQLLGGSAATALHRAEVDRLIGPLAGGDAALYLLLRERQADAPAYEDVAEAVRSEWARRNAERALEGLLKRLRDEARIRIADGL